jgi:hypothetical protein
MYFGLIRYNIVAESNRNIKNNFISTGYVVISCYLSCLRVYGSGFNTDNFTIMTTSRDSRAKFQNAMCKKKYSSENGQYSR